ncbi:nucleotide exchange factor GrpE [Marinilactibacillus sp. GCM10026970]|uniref:nucleotide exchange factor GrpE n=1 Tax=unclassified Marinilactibacillus TaxID=2632303 RepID=UPI001CE3BBB7|nr:nucleotide exchange factor GrpE [Marinilactibacillus sp. Marseille-P9653]
MEDNNEEILDQEVEATEDETEQVELDPVQEELEKTKQELEEVQDRYIRLQAELANIQKRNQREREQATRYRSQDLAKQLLPALDNMERALTIEVEDEAGKNLKKGIEMVVESINHALKSEGIEVIEAEGQPFDPNFHEAYTQVPAQEGQDSNVVAQVFEKGYKLNDRVLRAAKVTVTL